MNKTTVMDAGFVPSADEDLIQRHRELRLMLGLSGAVPTAAEYSYRARQKREHKLTAFVQRLLAGSLLFFAWACVLALLVG